MPLNHAKFKTFRIGSLGCDDCVAKNIEFRSNEIKGQEFDMAVTDQKHSYAVYWTLNIKVTNTKGIPVKNADITILDKNNSVVQQTKTDEHGKLKTELQEYAVNGKEKKYLAPYTITTGSVKKKVDLTRNTEIHVLFRDEPIVREINFSYENFESKFYKCTFFASQELPHYGPRK